MQSIIEKNTLPRPTPYIAHLTCTRDLYSPGPKDLYLHTPCATPPLIPPPWQTPLPGIKECSLVSYVSYISYVLHVLCDLYFVYVCRPLLNRFAACFNLRRVSKTSLFWASMWRQNASRPPAAKTVSTICHVHICTHIYIYMVHIYIYIFKYPIRMSISWW